MDNLKKQLLQSYLHQQNTLNPSNGASVASMKVAANAPNAPLGSGLIAPDNTLVLYNNSDLPENITLEEFKNYVKKWLEFDNFIKKGQEAIREKKQIRDKLSETITKFMIKYNIEDLNTKEGRIRCKSSYKKSPVSQKIVKERITDYFKTDDRKKEDILSKVFEEREKIEQVSLRRLKIT